MNLCFDWFAVSIGQIFDIHHVMKGCNLPFSNWLFKFFAQFFLCTGKNGTIFAQESDFCGEACILLKGEAFEDGFKVKGEAVLIQREFGATILNLRKFSKIDDIDGNVRFGDINLDGLLGLGGGLGLHCFIGWCIVREKPIANDQNTQKTI